MINAFSGTYSFLSNYYECPVTVDGITFRNSEAAFQAQKAAEPALRREFADLSPDAAKSRGRAVNLRSDWEKIKVKEMYRVCRAKFEQNPALCEKLIETGHEELIEGNDWGDVFWGMGDGTGENYLGRILMQIRNEFRGFDAAETAEKIISWIKAYFEENASPDTKAVIGISGGKDSSVAAALCKQALGKDRILGVLMPQGIQSDIDCSRLLVNTLEIPCMEVNIQPAYLGLMTELEKQTEISQQAKINTPARLRMTVLYAAAACIGGRVVNTCNLSEDWVGYATKFGDGAGDFSPLSDLTVTEVVGIGDYLGLPYHLVHKTPIDGLCGKTDEENLGFSYAQLDDYIRGFTDLSDKPELKAKIDRMYRASRHKLEPMPRFLADIY